MNYIVDTIVAQAEITTKSDAVNPFGNLYLLNPSRLVLVMSPFSNNNSFEFFSSWQTQA
jgi:hypothetical protein